jgi:hypothetical protein
VADAASGGQPNPVARAARKIHADDAIGWTPRGIARRIRGTKDGDNRRADGNGQVHRSRVTGDEEIETLDDRGKREQVQAAGNIDDICTRQRALDRVDEQAIVARAGQHDRGAERLNQASRDIREAFCWPLLDRPSAADVHADERSARGAKQPRGVIVRLGRHDESWRVLGGGRAAEDRRHQPSGVVGRVRACVVVDRQIE